MLGKLLDGRYQVNQVLGAGGFGRTYLAQDTRRPGSPICVVKHLQPANRDPNFLETARRLFNSEAETLEVLGNHDQIPRLLAYFEEDQEFYLVQEYIEGHPLSKELIPGQPWDETRVIALLQELSEVLEFVHNRGVIHRDLKPDNLIRRNLDKKLVLLDFGAVKQIRTQLATSQMQMSNTVAVGTPGYMSSEQALGQPRPTSDIYALGIIGIQAITGRMPAELQEDLNTGELIWQHLAPVSPGLKNILTRMVRYHFKDRYQSATEALQAVRSLTASPSTPYSQPIPPSRPTPQPTPLSEQGTLAVSPAAPPRQPAPPPPPRPPEPTPPSEPNRAPLVIGIGLVVAMAAAGMAYGIRQGLSGQGVARGNCTVTAQSLNVRSNPNAAVVGTVNKGTNLSLTGTKQGDWVEIRSPKQGWVFEQYIDCASVDTIAEQPASPTPEETQPSPTPVEAKPSPSPEPTPTPQKSPNQPKPDNGAKVLTEAAQEYQQGNLDKAIAAAQSVLPSSPAFEDAQKNIETWQKEWGEAKTKFDKIEQAYNEGRYVDVIIYAADSDFPEQRYWREKLNGLVRQATQRKNQGDTNQQNPPSSEQSNPQNPKPDTQQPVQPSPKPTGDNSVPICEPEAQEAC
ncbi:MAG: serine/threonine protein kinase [Coleofasciculus sp. G1-WW12-02]|uniref:protein kinase domain-containing protein n=1 Tax=Coleofasciculus sp. G1-WW12-02 TaxID=3068483 RepID=UPI0033027BFC